MGCYNSTVCVSIFLYADDILLLAPSVTGLQAILAACENELDNIDMRINVKKSMCIRFGKLFNVPCSKIISTHGGPLEWVNSCRYLGVFFLQMVSSSGVVLTTRKVVSLKHLTLF